MAERQLRCATQQIWVADVQIGSFLPELGFATGPRYVRCPRLAVRILRLSEGEAVPEPDGGRARSATISETV